MRSQPCSEHASKQEIVDEIADRIITCSLQHKNNQCFIICFIKFLQMVPFVAITAYSLELLPFRFDNCQGCTLLNCFPLNTLIETMTKDDIRNGFHRGSNSNTEFPFYTLSNNALGQIGCLVNLVSWSVRSFDQPAKVKGTFP